MTNQPKKIMFYVQHLLGIGHLARASLVCQQLVATGCEVKMVMGGAPVDGFPHPSVDVFQLPVLKAGIIQFNELTDIDGTIISKQYLGDRRDKLLNFFNDFQPDILVIEAFPFGRRQMRFELLPLLNLAKSAPNKTLIVSSVRDILQEKKKPERAQETVDTLKKYFDLLLVHGDPNFAKLEETFELTKQIEHLISYTGVVAGEVPQLEGKSYDVIVSAGGGAAGQDIMINAIKAKPLSKMSQARWCFLVGPNLSSKARNNLEALSDETVVIENTRSDFRALLANSVLSISQAGYNTTADILQAGCACVLVPYAKGGETEQALRAQKMRKHDLATIIEETDLTPQSMAQAINLSIAKKKPHQSISMDMSGALQSVRKLLSFQING